MRLHTLLSRNRYARAMAAGCVALAAGGIVLLRAPHGTTAPSRVRYAGGASGPTRAEFRGPAVHGRTALGQSAVQASGTRQLFAEVTVAADPRAGSANDARPVAMAVVLDVSGSMMGAKLEQAKSAVRELIDHMRANDQIALVTYSDEAQVVQPLARVGDVRERLRTVIPTIQIAGGTNIPSGLQAGAQALVEAAAGSVRRVVLMSDGQDGSGHALPEIEADVRRRAEQGVTLSSLGLGADYDERFLSGVADAGRGNYEFLRDAGQLTAFLSRELEQATGTTVERAVAEVTLPAGVRLTRAFGTEAEGTTGTVRLPVGALFAGDERRVVLDLAVDAGATGELGALAVDVRYRTVADGHDVRIDAGRLRVRAVGSDAEVVASRDAEVFAETASAALTADEARAVDEWRAGHAERAREIAQQNVAELERMARDAPAAAGALQAQASAYVNDATNFAQLSAASEAGRGYGLAARAANRRAQYRANSF